MIDSYYLDSQIRDDFTCTKACYTYNNNNNILDTRPQCTHTYDHKSQQLDSLADIEQQHKLYPMKWTHHYLQVIPLHNVHLI